MAKSYRVAVWAALLASSGFASDHFLKSGTDTYVTPPEVPWSEPPPAVRLPESPALRSVMGPVAGTRRTPRGALSNIVVFCNAGHGWSANTNTAQWEVDRPLLNGMVEDMGNIDQLNFFVQYCFNAGATIVPFRPVGFQTNEVALDNDDGGVTFTGTWYNSVSTIFYGSAGDTPYRYAYISTNSESAVAHYSPAIPVSGFYPVYTWVRFGTDRVKQLYRIRHAGGTNEIRVNHQRVGRGWVWLGTYWFDAGSGGYVDISNYAPGPYDPAGDVIIADAIRFGNGMGDVNRGFGVSGFPRELECSRYWIQRAVGQGMSSTLYDIGGLSDTDDDVGAAARMAAEMDAESDGDYWDRIYLGFHSNAGGLRGGQGLYSTSNPLWKQDQQEDFGLALNAELDTDMEWGDNGVAFNDDWNDTSADSYGSAYGEISHSVNSNMNSTIIEVAFHDDAEDAKMLKDPCARNAMARACYQGLLKYLCMTNSAEMTLVLLPDPPTQVRAINSGTGEITVSWNAPVTNAAGGDAATGYVLYRSANGYAFGPVAELDGGTNTFARLTNLAAGATWYFQVAAVNAGGESLPSETVGARVSPTGRAYHLVVNGFDRCDRSLCPVQYFGNNIGGNVTLVRPLQVNSYDYAVQHGAAIAAGGRYFDSCSHGAVTQAAVRLTNYHAAYWILGEESTADETFSGAEQTNVAGFLAGDGCLFVSGAELAWDLDAYGAAADKVFISNQLHAAYARDDAGTNRVTARAGSVFDGLGIAAFDDGSGGTYGVDYPDVLRGVSGAVTALVYGSSSAGTDAAALQYSNGCRLIVMGFPFETLVDAGSRSGLMSRTLAFFGDAPAERPGLAVTQADWTVGFPVESVSIGGTNNERVTGMMWWTNSLTGAGGTLAASALWTVPSVALAVGTNVIIVAGTNYLGAAASGVVAVARQGERQDGDGDGMADWWENLHFVDGTNAAADGDADVDSFLNWQEWVAGTLPTDRVSALRFAGLTNVAGGSYEIRWSSSSNRQYRLHWSANLAAGFGVLASNITATPPLNVHTDSAHSAEAGGFYRVDVSY